MKTSRYALAVLVLMAMTLVFSFLGFADRPADRESRFVVVLRLEEAGITGYFTEVSGLSSENEVVEYRDGNDPNVVRKLPGRLKYDNIVLKRGVTSDSSLWQWRRMVEVGNIAEARTNGKLTLLDRGSPVASWRFVNAWPSKVSGPQLNDEGRDIAIDELVIAHEGLTRE
jgi:phage tail-like protein